MKAGAPALRVALFYAALFAALGIHLPFWPLWLTDWGLSEAEIGAWSAAGLAVRVAAGPFLPMLADRFHARRAMLAGAGLFGAVVFALHAAIGTRPALFLATLATAPVFATLIPVGDALGVAAARARLFEYAHVRAAGSAAFLAASMGFGALIGLLGPDAALWGIVFFLALAAWLGWTHPGGGRVRAGKGPGWREARALLSSPVFLLFSLSIGLSQSSHAVLYVYGSLHWTALGIGAGEIGLLWAFSVAVEVALMLLWGPAMLRRLGAAGAMALSGAAGVARWSLMTLDPVGPLLWALQASHALTFAAGHLGAMAFLAAAVPERLSGSAQGIFQVFAAGLLMAPAMALAALVYPWAGGGAWWIAAAMSAAGLWGTLRLRRAWDGGALAR